MTLFQKVKAYLTGSNSVHEAPEGICPNCWGHQEYEDKFLEAVKNEKIDLNNIDQKKGWVDAYATRYFEGIKLKKAEEGLICATCKVSYKAN